MKKLLLVVATMLASNVGFSQAHTDSSLNTMTKMQLANVYLDQVVELAFNSPYTPFTIGVNDTIHGELDIPVSRYIKNKRETVMEMSKNYGETMKEDKKDMIRAILFLQEMNYNIKKK